MIVMTRSFARDQEHVEPRGHEHEVHESENSTNVPPTIAMRGRLLACTSRLSRNSSTKNAQG